MRSTRIYPLLKGYRHLPEVDMQRLEEMLVGLSQLMIDCPEIVELDLNPVVLRRGQTADRRCPPEGQGRRDPVTRAPGHQPVPAGVRDKPGIG